MELEGKNRSLHSQLSSLQSKEARLQAEIKSLEIVKSQLEERMRLSEDKLIATQLKLERAQREASELETQKGRIKREPSEEQPTLKSMCRKFDKLKANFTQLDDSKKACMAELSEQSRKVERLRDQLSQCKRENEELHRLHTKAEDNSRAKQNLTDSFESRVKYLDGHIDQLKSQLKLKEEEVSSAREFIQQQHAARAEYFRATATPSPFQFNQALRPSTQSDSQKGSAGDIEQVAPSRQFSGSGLASSPTSWLANAVAETPSKFPNSTTEGIIKVPSSLSAGNPQNDGSGGESRHQSRDPRLIARMKCAGLPQKRGVESIQDTNGRNEKGQKKLRSR